MRTSAKIIFLLSYTSVFVSCFPSYLKNSSTGHSLIESSYKNFNPIGKAKSEIISIYGQSTATAYSFRNAKHSEKLYFIEKLDNIVIVTTVTLLNDVGSSQEIQIYTSNEVERIMQLEDEIKSLQTPRLYNH